MSNSSGDFFGTDRFVIQRRVGAGGMGVVYEVYDRERGRTVALKALIHAEASAIYRFKREFRALADVAHPNLVSLYELMSNGKYWFFTMELIDGVNFLEYVRGGVDSNGDDSPLEFPTLAVTTSNAVSDPDYDAQTLTLNDVTATEEQTAVVSQRRVLPTAPLDMDRLRRALRQLAEGIHALHQMGMLHRDIKPPNVLVTREGRVVLLDFGLVTEVVPQAIDQSTLLVGTPAYMSPEQGAQVPVSEASDWYSVGIILYEALTGRLPFTGKFFEVMLNKQNSEPLRPSELVSGIPEDLDALCRDLLRRDPEARPRGREVLERLGAFQADDSRFIAPTVSSSTRGDAPFVGRERHIEALRESFRATLEGRTVIAYIHGTSGMGKSALARHFLEDLQRREKAIVILEGRCYERESVPYKALDGVIDSLTKYLMLLPQAEADALVPPDVLALSRLFPVMLQVDSVSSAPQREQEIPDPLALRRRAFAALGELLARISDRQQLVIYIDDLQWADADSVALLEQLLRPPRSPALFLIASFRSEEIESKPFLKSLLARADGDACRELSLDPLTKDEARKLALSLLGAETPQAHPFIETIVREAGGSPFFVEQLTGYALASRKAATTGITLAEMLDARLRRLPEGARVFVETLAVAGRPVNAEAAYQATDLTGDEQPLIASLRAARFLRSSGGSDKEVELYHDRIRETMTALLEPDSIRDIHRRLAQTFEAKGFDDPEALFEHYLGAGERERAAFYAAQAARKAAAALAFDQAALLYRRALELSLASNSDLVEIKAGLSEALANAGRPVEAAASYLDAARDAGARLGLEFRRRAAEQLLMGGHIDEGLEVIRTVLAAVGLHLAPGPKRALLSLLMRRAELRLRGLKYTERAAQEISEDDLLRIDICWSVAAGLGVVDNIRGADFQTRHLLLALRAGEPYRIARAMAVETGFSATPGGPAKKRSAQFLKTAEALSERVGHPHAIGMSMMTAGLAAYLCGEWKRAAHLCERAAEILRDRCTGVTWELTITHRFLLTALMYLGELAEVDSRLPTLLSAAKEQGNLYGATDLRTRLNIVWLAADEPDRARQEIIEALQEWPHKGFHLQHYSSLFAFSQTMLYTGDDTVAWKHINEMWPDLERSMLLRIQVVRLEARHLLARCALAAAGVNVADRKSLLQAAERIARQIAKEKMPWSDPLVSLIRAGIASLRSDKKQAATLLSTAADNFDAAEMKLYAAASRRRLGQIMGGEAGRQMVAATDQWMLNQKIKKPELMTRTLAPGFADDFDR